MFWPALRSSFFVECYGDHRDLHVLVHSFPTRRSSDLPEQAVLAAAQRTHRGSRQETEFHVAREVALVVDVAGGAVRALRELVERRHRGLGDTATRAQQIPAHGKQAAAHPLQAELDDRSEEHTSELQSLMRISYAV